MDENFIVAKFHDENYLLTVAQYYCLRNRNKPIDREKQK